MEIRTYECPTCKNQIRYDAKDAAKICKCPKCKKSSKLPGRPYFQSLLVGPGIPDDDEVRQRIVQAANGIKILVYFAIVWSIIGILAIVF